MKEADAVGTLIQSLIGCFVLERAPRAMRRSEVSDRFEASRRRELLLLVGQ